MGSLGRPVSDALVLFLFFISGFSGLIYQVAWARLLEHVFGVTTFATSAVLGAYFGGLAVGGWVGGTIADRRPGLRSYGLVEIALGVTALAVPVSFSALTDVYRWVHVAASGQMATLVVARFAVSFVVLLVPTSLMGMALPILVRTLVEGNDHIGRQLPRLYGWNTLGSVLGALVTGYVLIGFLGLSVTMGIAVALNVIAGGGALWAARGESRPLRPRSPQSAPGGSAMSATIGRGQRVALAVTFCSGFAALGYEVAWFRVLAALSDHRAHTFSAVVAVVLLGIGIGSFASRAFSRPGAHPGRPLAFVQLGLGSLGVLWLPLIVLLSSVGVAVSGVGTTSQGKSDVPMAVALLVTLAPCVLMGIAFPLAVQLYTQGREDVGRSVGWVYALNLIGAMLGSVLTGFFVLPRLGAQHTLFMLSALNFVAAALCLLPSVSRARPRLALPAAAGATVVVALLSVFAPRGLFEALFSRAYPGVTILESHEDIEAAVTVARRGDRMSMFINGAHQANDDPEMVRLHRLLGIVPALVHPDLRDAIVIGMGGGATSGQIAALIKNQLTIIELSPSVVTAARAFARHNQDVLDSPRTQVIVADGRNHLALSDTRYDLIAADTISPLHAHSGQLYSLDYYRLMASRLRARGLVLQWVDDSLKDHEQQIIMRTFVRAFPYVRMWQKGGRLLLGSNEPIAIDRAAIEGRLTAEALDGLAQQRITRVDDFMTGFTLADDALREELGSGPVITDDRPYNEYFNLLAIGGLWRWLPRE